MGADETVRLRDPGSETRARGVVVSERPSLVFEVLLETQHTILAHSVGHAAKNFVRLVPGDRVEVEFMPHDPTRGRIRRKL